MLTLAWDTATGILSMALVRISGEKQEVLDLREGTGQGNHSGELAPMASEILTTAGLVPGDLDLIAVGTGPGSFTGLRTGLALAKGLAMGSGCKILGLCSLAVLAANSPKALVLSLIDARHSEIFAALYRTGQANDMPEILTDILVLKPKNLVGALTPFLSMAEGLILTGPSGSFLDEAYLGLKDFYSGHGPEPGLVEQKYPKADLLAVMASRDQSPVCGPLMPLYGRPPDIFKTWKPPKRLGSPASI